MILHCVMECGYALFRKNDGDVLVRLRARRQWMKHFTLPLHNRLASVGWERQGAR